MNSITRGNDFGLHIALYQQQSEDAERSALNCWDIEDLAVSVRNAYGAEMVTEFDAEENNIYAWVDGTKLTNGEYRVEVTGKVSGNNIRGAEKGVFKIVEYNGEQNITFAPFEGEYGGTIPMTFCYYVSAEGTTKWVNRLTALEESIEKAEKTRQDNESSRETNESKRQANEGKRQSAELQREIDRLYEMFWNADARGGSISVDSDGVHLNGNITISTTDGDFDVKAEDVTLKTASGNEMYVCLLKSAGIEKYEFYARSMRVDTLDFDGQREITYPDQFCAPIGKFTILRGSRIGDKVTPDSVTPVAGPLYRRWCVDNNQQVLADCVAATNDANDAAGAANDAASKANGTTDSAKEVMSQILRDRDQFQSEYREAEDARQQEFKTNEKGRQNEFDTNEASRSKIFDKVNAQMQNDLKTNNLIMLEMEDATANANAATKTANAAADSCDAKMEAISMSYANGKLTIKY